MSVSTQQLRVHDVMGQGSMTPRRWSVIILCFLIALLDGFDTQSIAFIGPAIAEDFGMQPTDMTWVITASTIGMTIGAIGLGSFGDRYGRRKAIVIAMVLFGVFSILGAMATSPTQIIALRFLIGLGMGGATPSLLALTAEYSTSAKRSVLMTLVTLGLPGGALIGGLIAAWWLPAIGWRGIFLVGGLLPIALLALVIPLLPESPDYLATRRTEKAAAQLRTIMAKVVGVQAPADAVFVPEEKVQQGGSIAGLFSSQFRTTTLGISAIYLFNWIAWFLLLQWMPTALTTLGLAKATAAYGTVTVNGAFIAMAIPLSLVMARMKVRPLLLTMFGVGILVALGLGFAGSNWTLVFVLLACAGFGVGGQQLVLNYMISQAYPAQLRATATGWGIGIGRTGAIVGSAIGGALVANLGPSGYFMVLAIPLAIAAAATFIVRQEQATHYTSRRTITPHRD